MNIVIIGAGVAGLGIGWRLLQAGCSVTILERAQPAMGASWAAAGMLAVTAELEDAADAERALAHAGPCALARLRRRTGGGQRPGDLSVNQAGRCFWPPTPPSWKRCGRAPRRVADRGAGRSPRPGAAAGSGGGRTVVAARGPCGQPRPGRGAGHRLPEGGRRALSQRGRGAASRSKDGKVVGVQSPYRRYHADAVLIAAGAWSGLLDAIPIEPVKGEMIALTPPDPALAAWPGGLGRRRLLRAAPWPPAGRARRCRKKVSTPARRRRRATSVVAGGEADAGGGGLEAGRSLGGACVPKAPTACRCWGRPAMPACSWRAGSIATASCSRPPSRRKWPTHPGQGAGRARNSTRAAFSLQGVFGHDRFHRRSRDRIPDGEAGRLAAQPTSFSTTTAATTGACWCRAAPAWWRSPICRPATRPS